MRDEPNIDAFCTALEKHGLLLLQGVDDRLRPFIELHLSDSDVCYAADITGALEDLWDTGSEKAVAAALESYLELILAWLNEFLVPGSFFPWSQCDVSDELQTEMYNAVDSIRLRDAPDVIAILVAAATEPDPP